MSEPLPPEGYIRLKDAYDTFHFGMLGETPTIANIPDQGAYFKKSDEARSYFVTSLDTLAYGGKVISSSGTSHEITGDLFHRTTCADLLPLNNAIPLGTSGPLANYAGGIICLDKSRFFEWLEKEIGSNREGTTSQENLDTPQANASPINAKELRAWFLERIRNWSNDQPPPNKDKCYQDHRTHFKERELSSREFMELRQRMGPDAMVPPSWRKAGKRGLGWQAKLPKDWREKLQFETERKMQTNSGVSL